LNSKSILSAEPGPVAAFPVRRLGCAVLRLMSPGDVRMLVCLFAVILLGMVWAMTLHEIASGTRMQTALAERDARSFARAFEEHTVRTLESADQSLKVMRSHYAAKGDALDIGADMRSGLIAGGIYNLFAIVDKHGDVILASQPFGPTNLADRDHIRAHMAADTNQLFISKPVFGRISKKWAIQLTRRINAPDGSYNGAVIVSIDPKYFTQLYHEIGLGDYGSVSLTGFDGIVRARHAGDNEDGGQDRAHSALFKAMQANSNGVLTTVSEIDRRERVHAYRQLKDFPLFVSVGIDRQERMDAFDATRLQALQIAGFTTCIILAFAVSIVLLVDRLLASRTKAIEASAAKTRFLSNMSHELRTPLTGILGYSELLAAELGDTEQGGYARDIRLSGKRLLALVTAVLDLTALDAGTMRLTLARENLARLLEQAKARHAAAASAKGLALELTLAPGMPDTILCDARRFGQVLDSLLENAVRFGKRGAVRIEAQIEDDALRLDIADNGDGIPLARQRQIFDRFMQADDSDARAKDGAGLGLALAQQLAALMGGRITLVSEPGHGATFSFWLPLQQH
jgi:two-component system sensor histidine kinase BarA